MNLFLGSLKPILTYHDVVVRALIKDGWTIVQEQVYLSDSQRHCWVDLSAKRGDEALILVEIKSLESETAHFASLMLAVGQYMFYRAMLDYLGLEYELFLAVPETAYNGLLQSPAARRMVADTRLRFLVFDPSREEVVNWVR